MKKLLTVVLASVMAITGYQIIDNLDTSDAPFKQNTLAAAIPPRDLGLTTRKASISIDPITIETLVTDSVLIHDTVTVINTKYVKVPETKHTTDTIYMPAQELQSMTIDSVKNKSPGNTEDIDVVLTIDGKTVYSTKTTSDEP